MTPTQTPPRDNLIGSLFMIGAMAAFAVEDSFVKAAALTLPVGQILILFGLGGALCFALSARASGAALFPRAALSRVMQIRSLFEITGRLFYVLAIALTPLSSATVILQATPLLVVAGAALVFGEQVGWRRWSAIVIGLIGVIVIVQPGSDSFSALSIFAIIGMIGFALMIPLAVTSNNWSIRKLGRKWRQIQLLTVKHPRILTQFGAQFRIADQPVQGQGQSPDIARRHQ